MIAPRAWIMSRRSAIAFAGMVPVLMVALLRLADLPALAQVSNLIFDSYQRAAPRPYQDAGVRVVDIDDETISRFGQWPWPRSEIADLTEAIAGAGAAAIAFDIVFSEPDRTAPARLAVRAEARGVPAEEVAALRRLPDPDERFAEALAASPSVLGFFLTRGRTGAEIATKAGFAVAGSDPAESLAQFTGAIVPLPAFQEAAQGVGSVSIPGGGDGVVRSPPLIAAHNGRIVPSLSVEALRVAQGAGAVIVRSSDASGEIGSATAQTVALKVGDFEVPVTGRGELWMHYTGPVPERTVPAWRILSGDLAPAEMERLFAGHIVFVGAGAIGLRDLVATPVRDAELGVSVHAQAAEQMVLGAFLNRPEWVKGLEISAILVTGLILILVLPRTGAIGGAFAAAGLAALAVGGSWYAFRSHGLLVDPAGPAAGLFSAYFAGTLLAFVREERQRAYIHRAFDRYLSPELVKRITADPSQLELGGQEREMTVLFCDIRGFSRISERLGPQEIIRFLVAFLTPMTDILLARKATIDKFIGDAILAFWNAPLEDEDQYRNAARAALDMVAKLDILNREMAARPETAWPGEVRIGIGLNAGPCCVGNMGSAQRLSYSLIGDTVNLASRIEGLTKHYGVTILIGGELAAQLPGFAVLEVDRVRVVGRDRPAEVHALIGDEEVAGRPEFDAFRSAHEEMLAAYRGRRWRAAARIVGEQREAALRYGLARVYELYVSLLETYRRDPPPAEWDGVMTAARK